MKKNISKTARGVVWIDSILAVGFTGLATYYSFVGAREEGNTLWSAVPFAIVVAYMMLAGVTAFVTEHIKSHIED